ncbi:hypothetical protein [Magnetovibrio blakemorei]|nr:hypothetical protein [Magnetovibrio blakemorei]OEJ63704.1 hypothetical protein BEN30_17540 [Magnetovibrio blakemorei]
MNVEQIIAGKTVAQINDMADKLERAADMKAAAAAKMKADAAAAAAKAKIAGAKAAQVKVAANAANANAMGATTVSKATVAKTATAGVATKSSTASMIGTCCSSKSWTLGLGLGLGPWGPVLLTAGGAAAGYYLYKNYLKGYIANRMDAPSI